MTPTPTTPAEYYFAVAGGLLLYLVKKYIAGEGWHLGAFMKKELTGIINSVWVTVGIAYLIPDLVLYAKDLSALAKIATTYPNLVTRVTVAFGGALGFTGGSIALDLFPLLDNLPVIGPFLKKMRERMLSAKADRMAEKRGIDPNSEPKP